MLKTAFIWARTAIATLEWAPPFILAGVLVGDRAAAVVDAFSRGWARQILRNAKVQVVFENAHLVPRDRPIVVMSNHQSHLDPAAFLGYFPVGCTVVAKKELLKIPVFGPALKYGGIVIVDRGDSESARNTLEAAAQRIRNGRNVIIFPEGTRSRDGQMLPFKKGGAVLALLSRADVVPVAVVGSRELLPRGEITPRPGTIRLIALPPIPTREMTMDDRALLLGKVRDAIAGALQAAGSW